MHVVKEYRSFSADKLISIAPIAKQAYTEIVTAIGNMVGKINNSEKYINSVSPIKNGLINLLHDEYGWEKEKHLMALTGEGNTGSTNKRRKGSGGGIDVYKEFSQDEFSFRVGIEFETGNVASVHRSLNKLSLGEKNKELDLIVLVLPVFDLSYYLTDRVANYEEIERYFPLFEDRPFIAFGFDAEEYSPDFPIFVKGNDGNSKKK